MKGKIRFLGLVMVLGFVVAILVISASSWAQKGKPQPPPPADPAIAYVRSSGSTAPASQADLMIVNADGSNSIVLVSENGMHYGSPDWSPDGQQLVFTDDELGSGRIDFINVDGTGRRRLDVVLSAPSPVAWSPVPLADGKFKIAFFDLGYNPDGSRRTTTDLFIVNLDGTDLQQLTDTPLLNECPFNSGFAWSFDARYIAVAMYDDVLVYEIFYDANTGKFSVDSGVYIISKGGVITAPAELMDLDWANHQYKLVICAGWYDLYIVDFLNPADVFRLTSTTNRYEQEPAWSPDDSQIVFAVGGIITPTGIWVMNIDGTGVKQIVQSEKRFHKGHPQWRRNLY